MKRRFVSHDLLKIISTLDFCNISKLNNRKVLTYYVHVPVFYYSVLVLFVLSVCSWSLQWRTWSHWSIYGSLQMTTSQTASLCTSTPKPESILLHSLFIRSGNYQIPCVIFFNPTYQNHLQNLWCQGPQGWFTSVKSASVCSHYP